MRFLNFSIVDWLITYVINCQKNLKEVQIDPNISDRSHPSDRFSRESIMTGLLVIDLKSGHYVVKGAMHTIVLCILFLNTIFLDYFFCTSKCHDLYNDYVSSYEIIL